MIHSLLETLGPYLPDIVGFNIEDWGPASKNIIYTDNNQDFALFEYEYDKVYYGHIFCRNRRGKEALAFGKEALNFIFNKAKVIHGLTPKDKKHIVFFQKKLGFRPYGEVHTEKGLMVHFILTENEWRTT